MYVSNAASLFGGGTQLDFLWNGSITASSSSTDGSKKYYLSLKCRVNSLKYNFNWKVSSLGGLGQKESPFERRLISSEESRICDKFTTVLLVWTSCFSDGDVKLVLWHILLWFPVLSNCFTFLHFLSSSRRKILSMYWSITIELSSKSFSPLNLDSSWHTCILLLMVSYVVR